MDSTKFFLRRLVESIPIYFGICLIVFVLYNLSAPDPARLLLGNRASTEQIQAINEQLGLNKPIFEQYLDTLKTAFTFDFGRSWSSKQEVSKMFLNGLIPTLTLSIPAFVLSTIISLLIGFTVAHNRGKFIDRFFVFVCVFLMSISSLAYILFGQWFFAYKLGLFEVSGYAHGFPDFIPYILLPMFIWIVLAIGPDVRFFRTVILDELYLDYVKTARSKGLGEVQILYRHVLKNAMVPILTYVMSQLPFLILGALLLESFFGIPGVGGIVIDAIRNEDFPVLKAMTLITAVFYILINIFIDLFYKFLDPRIKL